MHLQEGMVGKEKVIIDLLELPLFLPRVLSGIGGVSRGDASIRDIRPSGRAESSPEQP